jgi:hypothetical protein
MVLGWSVLMLVLIPEWVHNNNPARLWFAWSSAGPGATAILAYPSHVIDASLKSTAALRTWPHRCRYRIRRDWRDRPSENLGAQC